MELQTYARGLTSRRPGLLEHEIWRIFETEPGRGAVQIFALAMHGALPEASWEVALAQLASEGKISRDRLLDASLDGLSRDFHDMRARWFTVMHDRLEPSLEERAARGARYLAFLGSHNPSTVNFRAQGLERPGEIRRSRPPGPSSIAWPRPLPPGRRERWKQAIALLDLAVRRGGDSALKSRAVMVAAEGLVHEAADVQSSILDLIERHVNLHDPPLKALLAARLESNAVSQRGRLAAWLDVRAEQGILPVQDDLGELLSRAHARRRLAASAGSSWSAGVCPWRNDRIDRGFLTFDGTEIPRLDLERRLEPIEDLDTLIELCSRLIENLDPVEDADRCVEAISRLCDRRPTDFETRTAPLAARLKQRLNNPAGMSAHLTNYFGVVLRSWLTGEVAGPFAYDRFRALEGFLSAWVCGIARRVGRREAAPLLAAPTHAGGWIDPRILVDRFHRRCRLAIANEPADLILALLRLSPDKRSAALANAHNLE